MVRSTHYLLMMLPIITKDQVEELLPTEIMKMKNEEVLEHPHFCTEIQYNDFILFIKMNYKLLEL